MVEVLVAFVVMATLSLAVYRGLNASLSSMTKAEERIGADLVARSLISAPLGSGVSALQAQNGRMNGYDWSVRFDVLQLPVTERNVNDGKPPLWRPVRMMISVRAPSGSEVKVETIRLAGG